MDHKDFKERGEKADKLVEESGKEWWLASESDMPTHIEGVVRYIKERSSRVEQQRQVSARLYGNLQLSGLQGISINRASGSQPSLSDRITYNVCQSVVDTVTAKIAKNRPRPLFLTDGGSFTAQRKAERMTKFVDGIFYENETRRTSPLAFRYGCVFGDAFTHVYDDQKRVRFEHVLPSELFVDEIEGFYGKPRQMHRVKIIDRRVLAQMFPGKAKKIEAAQASIPLDLGLGAGQNVGDQLTAIESWHLPSGPDAGDGCHVITIPDCVLTDKNLRGYEHDFFPFARFSWSSPLFGFWARGLVESIQNIQLELNKLLWMIQRSMHLMGTWKIALEYGSKVNQQALNNEIGTIIWYKERQPLYLTPQVVPAEYYAHFERLVRAAYDQAGISMLSATSEKPAGLNSGAALREYEDVESDRFGVIGASYEDYHLDLAKLSVVTAKDIAERDGNYEVNVAAGTFADRIKWSEVELEKDDYVMQVYPVSSLPKDPAGRIQSVVEGMQAGLYSQRVGKRLLDQPDVSMEEALETAPERRIIKTLEDIVAGKYEPPDAFMDLQVAKELTLEYYNLARLHNASEKVCDDLATFSVQVDALTMQAMQAMAPPPGAAPPGANGQPANQPTGVPQPPPQSEMQNNVPTA